MGGWVLFVLGFVAVVVVAVWVSFLIISVTHNLDRQSLS